MWWNMYTWKRGQKNSRKRDTVERNIDANVIRVWEVASVAGGGFSVGAQKLIQNMSVSGLDYAYHPRYYFEQKATFLLAMVRNLEQ